MIDLAVDDGPFSTDDGWRQVEQRHYAPDGPDELVTVVLLAVAAATGVDATALKSPRPYDVIDSDAVETALFGEWADARNRGDGACVEFAYRDCLVRVGRDGRVQVFLSANAVA